MPPHCLNLGWQSLFSPGQNPGSKGVVKVHSLNSDSSQADIGRGWERTLLGASLLLSGKKQ